MIGKDILGETTKQGKGLGLGLDLDINLNLSGVNSLVSTLSDALNQTGAMADESVSNVVQTIQGLGVEELKSWAQQGGEQAQNAFNQLVSKLQEAAQRGQQEAMNLLNSMGEKVETAGEKMQDVASDETRH